MTFSKILVAYDFSEPANRALAMGADLAAKLGATLDVVHVHVDIYDGHTDPSIAIPWATPDQTERYLRFLHEELRRAATGVAPALADKITYHVLRGDPVKRLEALADEIGANLICLGSTGKGAVERVLLGSVSQLVLRTSKVPVLSVH